MGNLGSVFHLRCRVKGEWRCFEKISKNSWDKNNWCFLGIISVQKCQTSALRSFPIHQLPTRTWASFAAWENYFSPPFNCRKWRKWTKEERPSYPSRRDTVIGGKIVGEAEAGFFFQWADEKWKLALKITMWTQVSAEACCTISEVTLNYTLSFQKQLEYFAIFINWSLAILFAVQSKTDRWGKLERVISCS